MALTNPIYNLEEDLDIYLSYPFNELKNIKGHIEAIIEDDFLEELSVINSEWLEYLNIEQNLITDPNLEIFYVLKLYKKIQFKKVTDSTETTSIITIPVDSKILLPQSLIDIGKTTNIQLEPNSYVLDFNFDYTNGTFKDPDDMMKKIQAFIEEQTNELITSKVREIDLYEEGDLTSILRLLNVYYAIDLPTELINTTDNKKPSTEYGNYNRNSVRNILSSAIDSQVVISSSKVANKVVINRKIEISLSSTNKREVQCIIYNRSKYEIKTFKY